MELKLALHALTSQIRVGLSYDADADLDHTISLRARNVAFYDVLDLILEGTGLEYLVVPNRNTLIIRPQKENAANLRETITGQVIDALTGEALPGVNVEIQGTTSGTTTNIDGNYSLEVPDDDAVLEFSFIGYETTEVPIEGRSTIDVSL
jgi:TonB-dependent starch-binding outer membrane protein SusC